MSDGPTTRGSSLTRKDVEELLAAHVKSLEKRGGQITLQDPRVTSFQAWVWAALGAGIIILGGWLVNSINKLNTTMERVVTSNEYIMKSLDQHAKRLDDLESLHRR